MHSKSNILIFSQYFISLLLALICGFGDIQIMHLIADFISKLFINIFRFLSIPIIAFAIISTISNYMLVLNKNIWRLTVFYTFLTTFISAFVSFIIYIIVKPRNIQNSAIEFSSDVISTLSSRSYMNHILSMIPNNIVDPFLNNKVISVLMISILFGLAIRSIKDERSKELMQYFFQGLYEIFIFITKLVIKLLPIAFFGFITMTIVQFKTQNYNIISLSQYIFVILASNLIQGFIILPLLLKKYKISPFKFFKNAYPALAAAFISKSSSGTIPVTINVAETRLDISSKISKFVIPLCTTINMNGCSVFIFVTIIYMMQNYGLNISIIQMMMWVVIAVIAAIGNAGVPMGCFFMSVSILSGLGIPTELMGIILPFYSLLDMVETTLNVWSDITITKIINTKNIHYEKHERT